MITYKLKINYQDPRVLTSDMEFVTGDVGAYRLECSFYDNGERADLTGMLFTVNARRADGAVFTDAGEIIAGKAAYVLKNSMYSVPGEVYLELALSDKSGNYVTAKIITANAIASLSEGSAAIDEDDAPIYVTLMNQIAKKADKETPSGGFVAGYGANGNGAGFISIGSDAYAGNGGVAIGTYSKTDGYGMAGGIGAEAGYGAAVGYAAKAGSGFSGGSGAKAAEVDGAYIDAIQLGTGTNETPKTLQVYNHQLMDANGKIPAARLPMDILAPYFERTGSEVSCYPVDGGVFDVVSQVTLKQGEGTPSFENPLPISGFDSITLTANGTEFTANLGQTVYGGTFDWNSGTLTVTYTKEVLDGTRAYSRHSPWDTTDTYCFYVPLKKVGKRPIYESGVCDKLSNIGSESNREGFLSTNDRRFLYIKIFKEKLFNEPTGDNLKAYLSENPIEFCYDIEPAEIVSLTPQEISVLSGENVFSSDCGETTVKCNEQVTAVINRLSERIAQLEAAGN